MQLHQASCRLNNFIINGQSASIQFRNENSSYLKPVFDMEALIHDHQNRSSLFSGVFIFKYYISAGCQISNLYGYYRNQSPDKSTIMMQARKNQRTKGTMLHNRGKGSFHSKGVNSFAAIKGVLFQIFSLARSSCNLGITFSTIKMNA